MGYGICDVLSAVPLHVSHPESHGICSRCRMQCHVPLCALCAQSPQKREQEQVIYRGIIKKRQFGNSPPWVWGAAPTSAFVSTAGVLLSFVLLGLRFPLDLPFPVVAPWYVR
jgi:hypothetical protein